MTRTVWCGLDLVRAGPLVVDEYEQAYTPGGSIRLKLAQAQRRGASDHFRVVAHAQGAS